MAKNITCVCCDKPADGDIFINNKHFCCEDCMDDFIEQGGLEEWDGNGSYYDGDGYYDHS